MAALLNKWPGASLVRRRRVVFALLLVGLASGAILGFSSYVREWLWSSLGYGFIPVGLWVVVLTSTFHYRRSWVNRFYGLWAASALVVVAVLGVLSLFYPRFGVLEETGLSGSWGRMLGGEPIYAGLLKVVLALWLASFVAAPQWVSMQSRRGIALLYRCTRSTLVRLALTVKPRQGNQVVERGGMEETQVSLPWRLTKRVVKLPHIRPVGESSRKSRISTADVSPDIDEVVESVKKASKWRLPSVDLLSKGQLQSTPLETLKDISGLIEKTLSEHGVDVSVKDIKTGPRVIRFGLVPGWVKKAREMRGGRSVVGEPAPEMSRVKVHSILARERDLALALKTSDLRIESPVPGEALVGLEVPNPVPNFVLLRSVAESPPFKVIAAAEALVLGLGQGTGGEPVSEDLLELPHLLIAGATGSGKSVCINSIIASLLMANRPDRLRMLMVDPKRVELTPFNGLPHLITPVIVDSDRVLTILRGLVREMFRRYRMLEEKGVRNVDGYNRKSTEPMPYIVLVIDELADLMMTEGYEVEQVLVRLAQLGRATAIHLILCTQRPSVNVVTGLLKANIPARIAFAVSSQVDSRVILDGAGAEKLLGKGDMLFLSAQSPKPRRIQGTFVSDREIDQIVEFWRSQKGPSVPEIFLEGFTEEDGDQLDDSDDALLDQARKLAEKYHHVSPSLLQRRLQIGYQRAMGLIESLEDEGFVAEGDPGRAREVIGRGGGNRLE